MPDKTRKTKRGLWAIMAPIMIEIRTGMALGALGALAAKGGLVFLALALSILMDDAPAKLMGLRFSVSGVVLLVAALTVLSFVCRHFAFRISHLGAFRLEQILRTDLSDHLARLPLGFVIDTGSGALKKVVLDDVKNLHAFVADSTPFIGRSIAAPLFSLIMLLIIDWRLALVSVCLLGIGCALMGIVMKDSVALRKEYEQSREKINTAVIEFVQAMPVVRVFDDGTGSFRRFTSALIAYRTALKNWIDVTAVPAKLGMVVLSPMPTLLAVGAAGAVFIHNGTLSLFSFTAALLLSTGMADAVKPLMWLSEFNKKAQASAFRIQEVFSVDPLPTPAKARRPVDSSVVFEDVSFRYENRNDDALHRVSFTVPAGTVTALVGPSGAGKSTAAKLIPRFWDVGSGSIKVGGADIREIPPDILAETVSFVFQDTFLFQDTIANNIRMAKPNATRDEIFAAARAARIHDFIRSLPGGYETMAGDRGIRLSGGEQQRITIARAILRDAPVVILDEATAFSDPENEEAVITALANLTKNKTVIVIAHKLGSVKDVHQIVVFDKGNIVEKGRHDQLVEAGGLYGRFWHHYEQAQAWNLRKEGNR